MMATMSWRKYLSCGIKATVYLWSATSAGWGFDSIIYCGRYRDLPAVEIGGTASGFVFVELGMATATVTSGENLAALMNAHLPSVLEVAGSFVAVLVVSWLLELSLKPRALRNLPGVPSLVDL